MGKLHGSVRHMFLNAASVNGEDAAEDLPDSCKSFLIRIQLLFLNSNFVFLCKKKVIRT